jgi:hypothetical protein
MANTIDPGTIACVPGTMSGDIYAVWMVSIGVPITPSVEAGLKQMSFAFANGIVDNIVASITDTNVLQILSGVIVGTARTGGDVVGPSSAVDDRMAAFDGTTGKLIKQGSVTATAVASHLTDTANPHVTDVGNIGSGTLAELNTAITDATLDDASDPRTPTSHATSHEDGGGDEISVLNLSGLLADGQTPLAHSASHENGGGDEISVLGLSGLLADGQTPLTHATSHQNGGGDEINVAALSGQLADPQLPDIPAFSGYDAVGGQSFTTPAVVINIDTEFFASSASYYTLASDAVTVVTTGRYQIAFAATFTSAHASKAAATEAWLELDSVEITGTRASMYVANSSQQSTGAAIIVVDLTAAEVIRIAAIQIGGSANSVSVANATRLTLTRIG